MQFKNKKNLFRAPIISQLGWDYSHASGGHEAGCGHQTPPLSAQLFRPAIHHRFLGTNKLFAFTPMSHPSVAASESSSPKFQVILDNALKVYEKRTKKNLVVHPLASQIQACESPGDIIAVLQQQIQGLDQSRSADERWTKWLDPTINVLFTFPQTVGTVGLVRDALIRNLHSHIYLAGIIARDSDICGNRASPFGMYSR